MSGMQASGVGAAGCSSALPHQQKQEVTVAGFSDEAIAKIIKAYNDSQKMEQAELDHQQQQQEVTAAGFSRKAELDHQRGWLMALATLIASFTYAAALSPPGGFWGADDKANGYVAGTPVFRDKFPMRYQFFYYCNALSFAFSLSIIVMLSNRKPSFDRHDKIFLVVMVFMDFFCLFGALVAASTTDARSSVFIAMFMLSIVLLYPLVMMLLSSIERGNRAASN